MSSNSFAVSFTVLSSVMVTTATPERVVDSSFSILEFCASWRSTVRVTRSSTFSAVAPGQLSHRPPQLVLVHDAGPDQGLSEAPALLALLHEGDGAAELVVRDAAERHQGLAQAVLLQVARGEDQSPAAEEDGLDHAARADLELTRSALGGEPPQRLRDRCGGQV
jgi:hypothetical protein